MHVVVTSHTASTAHMVVQLRISHMSMLDGGVKDNQVVAVM